MSPPAWHESYAKMGPASEALWAEVSLICEAALDESPGEGYHRCTTHEESRAPASAPQHVKQVVRAKQSVTRLLDFVREHGEHRIRNIKK